MEVCAYEARTKLIKSVKPIGNANQKIFALTILDFTSTKKQAEIVTLSRTTTTSFQLQLYDIAGTLLKTNDVGKDVMMDFGMNYNDTLTLIITRANEEATLLDSKGNKTKAIKGKCTSASWFTIGNHSLLLFWDGKSVYIRPLNEKFFGNGKGYSIESSSIGAGDVDPVNSLTLGSNLIFFARDSGNTERVWLGKLPNPEKA